MPSLDCGPHCESRAEEGPGKGSLPPGALGNSIGVAGPT